MNNFPSKQTSSDRARKSPRYRQSRPIAASPSYTKQTVGAKPKLLIEKLEDGPGEKKHRGMVVIESGDLYVFSASPTMQNRRTQ
ncbi:hypothetical protein PanWU01x14_254380 [Parasponia andersonii]|uniref:Uncharacterized protein n=1 Tax=Parasponia andersonii TaxID=3476 RepID=A0A2P5BB63_PARAD|nr:hypothetical protein PanWU01x14_254380 [Parasponia andersonii]